MYLPTHLEMPKLISSPCQESHRPTFADPTIINRRDHGSIFVAFADADMNQQTQ